MSDLPEFRNEPTIESSHGDLEEFARGYIRTPDRRGGHKEQPPRSRFKSGPTLIAILVAIIGGWHWFATNYLEEQLEHHFGEFVRDEMPDLTIAVDVHPLTNLVEIQITRSVRGKEGAYEAFGDALLEYLSQQIEPAIDRELSERARRDTDIYAMMVPYQVSIAIDKVRMPAAPPPSRMVQEIQRLLSRRGYDPGAADGRMGQRTRDAIQSYQRDHRLTDDGRANGELLERLRTE